MKLCLVFSFLDEDSSSIGGRGCTGAIGAGIGTGAAGGAGTKAVGTIIGSVRGASMRGAVGAVGTTLILGVWMLGGLEVITEPWDSQTTDAIGGGGNDRYCSYNSGRDQRWHHRWPGL